MAATVAVLVATFTGTLAAPNLKTIPALHSATGKSVASPLNFLGNRIRSAQVPMPTDIYYDKNSTDAAEGRMYTEHNATSFDTTVKEMEDTVTNLMLSKSAFGATPMGDSVQKIISIVKKTMEPKVIQAHESDQKQLLTLAAEIEKCGSDKTSGLEIAQVQFIKYEKESRMHQTCRANEATKYTSKTSCLLEQKNSHEVKKLKCKAFAAVSNEWGGVKHNAEIVKKGGSESVESYVTRLSTTFCGKHNHGSRGQISRRGGWGGGLPDGMLDKYLKAKDACAKATKAWESKVKECKRKIREYSVKKGQCNNDQTFMDGSACKRAVLAKDACESYAGCYSNKKKAYRTIEGKVRFEVIDRKAEWRGLKRIGCLIDAFADGRVTNEEIGVCRNATVDTDRFDINYPDIPPLEKCIVPNLFPATDFYKKKEFAPLPAVAKGKESLECTGMEEISLTPKPGSPDTCRCQRVTMNGYYSAGPLIVCKNCLKVRKSTQKNSCPVGTKIFSPASQTDWKTFIDSAPITEALSRDFIVDVTQSRNGCSRDCSRRPMNSKESSQTTWRTADGSPWWLRSTKLNFMKGSYYANCYLKFDAKGMKDGDISFRTNRCNEDSKSYFCQKEKVSLTPAKGSPSSCRCTSVTLNGEYSAGSLVKCEHCLDVRRSTQKNSCPSGMKIFSPRSKRDWRTFLDSAGELFAPGFIVDVTRPQRGCGGCQRSPMMSTNARQATWRTSDGSPWWLRSTKYSQPSGDYTANCYLGIARSVVDENNVRFNDNRCRYHSSSYYCQPKQEKRREKVKPRRKKDNPAPARVENKDAKTGFLQLVYNFGARGRCGRTRGRPADMVTVVYDVNYARANQDTKWTGFQKAVEYQAMWSGILSIETGGVYTFTIGSDDGSKLFYGRRVLVNNDGSHGYREKHAAKKISAGQHKMTLQYFQGNGDHVLSLKYEGPDTGNELKSIPKNSVKYERPMGFKEEIYYPGLKHNVKEALVGPARQTRLIKQVAYGAVTRKWPGFLESDGFAVRWSGFLKVHRGGRYRFWIRSDDGSILYLDGKLLVNNDGEHSMRTKYSDKELGSGSETEIKLEYFERTGKAGIVLKYMGPDSRNRLRVIRRNRVKANF